MGLPIKKHKQHLQKIIREGTSLDKIQATYIYDDEIILTPKEQELKNRWDAAFSLLCNYHSTEQAIPVLQQRFNISRAAAYRDIANAKQIFGDITRTSKEADRYILYEWAQKTFQIATKNGDVDGMNRAISNMIKIKRIDQDDPMSAVDPELLEKHEYIIVAQVDGKAVQVDLTKMAEVPEASRKQLLEGFYSPITDVEAEDIMKS